MIDADPRVFDPPALAGDVRRARHRRVRRLEFYAPADRCGARHHQRAGADQHHRARLLAARDRAAHHLPDRDRDGRPAAARIYALAVALRPEPGHRRLPRRHRHLFCAPAGQRAHPAGQGPASARRRDRDGPGLHRPRRDLPCTRWKRGRMRRAPTASPTTTTELRTIQDWIIKPQLRTVPGVVEVNTHRRL